MGRSISIGVVHKGEGVRTAEMLWEVLSGEPGSLNVAWSHPAPLGGAGVDFNQFDRSRGEPRSSSVCAVWILRGSGHKGAIQGDPVGQPTRPQKLRGAKSMKLYRKQ